MAKINSVDQLRSIYRKPRELAANKVLTEFEEHSRRFVKLSPFLVISTIGADGIGDVSPRGDAPGFVKVMDDNRTIAIIQYHHQSFRRDDILHPRHRRSDAGKWHCDSRR